MQTKVRERENEKNYCNCKNNIALENKRPVWSHRNVPVELDTTHVN